LREKLRRLVQSPYEQTLFLDTDTYLLSGVHELFDLLDQFDVAATHDRAYADWFPPEAHVPDSFRELNTGVLAYRRSGEMADFFNECVEWYDRLSALPQGGPLFRGHLSDQPAFRAAAYYSRIRIATITFEYNCRFPYFGYASGSIKLLHGREFLMSFSAKELDRVAEALNAASTPRVYVAGDVLNLARARFPWTRRYVPQKAGNCFGANWRWLLHRIYKRSIHSH
jgi:hypothetical protein